MKSSDMGEALYAMYKVYIKQQSQKKRVVWVYGKANSGKTFLAEMLKKIFYFEDYADIDSKFTHRKDDGDFKT